MRTLLSTCLAMALSVVVAFAGDQLNGDATLSRNDVKVATAYVQGNGFFVDIVPENRSVPPFSGAWDFGTKRYEDEDGNWYSFTYTRGTTGTWTRGGPGGMFE